MKKKVIVRHFHEGNDASRSVRDKATYATQARVVDLETGETVTGTLHTHDPQTGEKIEIQDAEACCWAFCSRLDVPTRAQGRAVAIGRLQKQFPEVCSDADFGVFEKLKVHN